MLYTHTYASAHYTKTKTGRRMPCRKFRFPLITFMRSDTRQRQREGIEAARSKDVLFGRPPKSLPEDFARIYTHRQKKEINRVEAASLCDLSTTTFTEKRANSERRRILPDSLLSLNPGENKPAMWYTVSIVLHK